MSDEITNAYKTIVGCQQPLPYPFQAGRDCALNGANTANCDSRYFATPESLAEWEKGKASVTTPELVEAKPQVEPPVEGSKDE